MIIITSEPLFGSAKAKGFSNKLAQHGQKRIEKINGLPSAGKGEMKK